jgi:hypothetical protein
VATPAPQGPSLPTVGGSSKSSRAAIGWAPLSEQPASHRDQPTRFRCLRRSVRKEVATQAVADAKETMASIPAAHAGSRRRNALLHCPCAGIRVVPIGPVGSCPLGWLVSVGLARVRWVGSCPLGWLVPVGLARVRWVGSCPSVLQGPRRAYSPTRSRGRGLGYAMTKSDFSCLRLVQCILGSWLCTCRLIFGSSSGNYVVLVILPALNNGDATHSK